jgi:hypothetical protein
MPKTSARSSARSSARRSTASIKVPLKPDRWIEAARLLLTSRALDRIEETELVPAGKVTYQFSARGHELSQILIGLRLDQLHAAAQPGGAHELVEELKQGIVHWKVHSAFSIMRGGSPDDTPATRSICLRCSQSDRRVGRGASARVRPGVRLYFIERHANASIESLDRGVVHVLVMGEHTFTTERYSPPWLCSAGVGYAYVSASSLWPP